MTDVLHSDDVLQVGGVSIVLFQADPIAVRQRLGERLMLSSEWEQVRMLRDVMMEISVSVVDRRGTETASGAG